MLYVDGEAVRYSSKLDKDVKKNKIIKLLNKNKIITMLIILFGIFSLMNCMLIYTFIQILKNI